MRFFFILLISAALPVLGGCSNLGYYAHSLGGQYEVLSKRRPIDEVIRDPDTEPALREKLHAVLAIRRFASEALALPDNDSYRSYTDLGRPYVVWNVFATPEFSLEPVQWCFPLLGCVVYRGYFSEDQARAFARRLAAEGKDTYVAGIAAYSTLGWFDDPVLNTVLNRPLPDVAGLIFHELAHQRLYIKNDTAFNESFAMTVELEGTRRWLQATAAANQYAAYRERKRRREQFVQLLLRYRERLKTLYASTSDTAVLRAKKAAAFAELRRDYARLKREQWGGYAGYDRWFAQELNNAHLVSVGTYHRYVPAFQALLRRKDGDFQAYYEAAEALGEMEPAARRRALARLERAAEAKETPAGVAQPRRAKRR